MIGIGQTPPIYRGIPGRQLLCVSNPIAGSGQAPAVAAKIQDYCQSGLRPRENRYEVTLLPTVPDRLENIRAIADEIGRLSRNGRPLRVFSIGGDGTLDLVISGYLTFLFGSIETLPMLRDSEMSNGLKECPIRLGIVDAGSAGDLGALYGAPKPKAKHVARYLAEGVDATLHLGMAIVHNEDRQEIWPFVHSFAAGHVFTPILVDANAGGRRGKEAMRWMLRHGVGRILGRAEKRTIHWKRSNGTEGEMPAQDSLAHALPRLAVAVGLPGLPSFEGIGFKFVPETGFFTRLLIGTEMFGSGLLSRMGRLVPLSAGARLATVPESHQMTLNVGEWIEFYYSNSESPRSEIGYQVSGDGIGYTCGPIRIQALPAIEHFIMTPGAPMGKLLHKNLKEG